MSQELYSRAVQQIGTIIGLLQAQDYAQTKAASLAQHGVIPRAEIPRQANLFSGHSPEAMDLASQMLTDQAKSASYGDPVEVPAADVPDQDDRFADFDALIMGNGSYNG